MFGSTVTGRRAHAPEDLYWVLRSLKHHLRPQRQGHNIIDLPEETGVERRGARRLKGRERAIVNRAPGEIKRSRDLRGGRWSWTLTFAQKRSWVGRWSWAEQVGRLLLRVVQVVHQQRCNGHCLSDSVQHSSWKSNCAVHKSLGNGEGTPP